MKLISKGITVETSHTRGGNFIISREIDGSKAVYSTPSLRRFLKLLYGDKPMEHEIIEGPVHNFDHRCSCCSRGFNIGQGFKIGFAKVCTICHDNYAWFDWHRQRFEINDRQIYELEESPL